MKLSWKNIQFFSLGKLENIVENFHRAGIGLEYKDKSQNFKKSYWEFYV
jgi:hypothetical protein